MVSGFNHLSITNNDIANVINQSERTTIIVTNISTEKFRSFYKNKKSLIVDVDVTEIGKHTLIFNVSAMIPEQEPIYVAYISSTSDLMHILMAISGNEQVTIIITKLSF